MSRLPNIKQQNLHLCTLLACLSFILFWVIFTGIATLGLHFSRPRAEISQISSAGTSELESLSTQRIIIKYHAAALNSPQRIADQAALNVTSEKLKLGAQALRYVSSVSKDTIVAQPLNDASSLEELLSLIAKDETIAYVVPDTMATIAEFNDPLLGQQWTLRAPTSTQPGSSDFVQAWERSPKAGAGVVVAVLDTGYLPHADLVDQLLPGYDFISSASNARDGNGRDSDAYDNGDSDGSHGSSWHGTAVAGLLAGSTNNNLGIAGLAYGSKILPVRVLGASGGYVSDISAGILWAAGISVPGIPDNPNPAKVINFSFSAATACNSVEQDAVNQARAKGVILVAATGNEGQSNSIGAPANCAGVIAVTAVTASGDLGAYANVNSSVTLSAPGGGSGKKGVSATGNSGIPAPSNTGFNTPASDTYLAFSGTSFAAPHVAATAAMILADYPQFTPDQIQTIITTTIRAFPKDSTCFGSNFCGSGILDANAALAQAALEDAASRTPVSVSNASTVGATTPVVTSTPNPTAATSPAPTPTSTSTTTSSSASSGGGGGCTVATNGSADFGLLLLVAASLLMLAVRKIRTCNTPANS